MQQSRQPGRVRRLATVLTLCAVGLVASCTLGVPQVELTPTIAPSDTPTVTPTIGPTRVIQEPTEPPLPTLAPSTTPTVTPSVTLTPTATPTGTRPPTDTPTRTPTVTVAPSVTPLPTIAPTFTPSHTPTISPTPSPTFVPLPPPTQTPRLILPTSTALPPTPTATLPPQDFAPFTQVAPPTIDTAPTFITDTAPTPQQPLIITQTPPPPNAQGDPAVPTLIPSFTPLPPTVDVRQVIIPPTVSARNAPQAPAPRPATSPGGLLDFTLGNGQGVPVDGSVNTSGIDGDLFAVNPANPDEFTVVNGAGVIYVGDENGPRRLVGEPFTEFVYQTTNRAENNANVIDIKYSAIGKLAFIVRGNQINIDGVWYVENGVAIQVLRDCPREGHPGCLTVLPDGRDFFRWQSRDMKWQPAENDARLIVEVDLLDEGRGGFMIYDLPPRTKEILPRLYRYDSANWTLDGTRITVSGRDPGGRYMIGVLDPASGRVDTLFDGSAVGVYPQEAVELPDGQIRAFGSSGPGGVVRLIDGSGSALSGNVGGAPPAVIRWNYDYSTAFIQTTDRRSYLVSSGGSITDVTNGAPGSPAAQPAGGGNPPPAPGNIPSGVVEGSRYSAGQQLRILNPPGLNVRAQPSTETAVVGSLSRGDYIVVLAGPVDDPLYTWWQIESAAGVRGWVAGTIEGTDTISP